MKVSVTKNDKTLSAEFPCLGDDGSADAIYEANGENAVHYQIEKLYLRTCKGKLAQSEDMTDAERNKMAKECRPPQPKSRTDKLLEKVDALSDDEAERLLAALEARGKAPKPASKAA